MGDSNSDCGNMTVVADPRKAAKNKGCEGTLTRYVSLSGKAAPRPCARVIRELRPVHQCLRNETTFTVGAVACTPGYDRRRRHSNWSAKWRVESPDFARAVCCWPCCSPASAAGPEWRPADAARRHFWPRWPAATVMAVAQELHPDEVEKLRTRLLALLRAEASRADNTYRSRLFGPGRSLAELESMTAVRFYAALSDRVRLRARDVREVRLAGRGARRQGGVPRSARACSRRSAAR